MLFCRLSTLLNLQVYEKVLLNVYVSTSVDRLLNPANRVHMSLEEQLRELLEKLDLTCAMKSSGSRSKRAKLLKKEINLIRLRISQQHHQPPQIESGIGSFEEENAVLEQEGEEEGKRCVG